MPISVYGEVNPDLSRFQVSRNAILWRYMDLGKYLDLITIKKLWFTRAVEFRRTDPYESVLTSYDEEKTADIVGANTKEELRAMLTQHHESGIARMMDHVTERSLYFFQLVYLTKLPNIDGNAYTNSISCWHENKTESAAMWALYAHRDAGIAIKTSVARILKAFESSDRNMTIAKVTYDSDNTLSALTSGIYDSLLIKRHAFHHENEVRILTMTLDGYESPEWTKENQSYNIEPSRSVQSGFHIECDIAELIEEVVISPLIAPYAYQSIEEISKLLIPMIPIRKSNLLTRPETQIKLSNELNIMLTSYRNTRMLRDIDEIQNASKT